MIRDWGGQDAPGFHRVPLIHLILGFKDVAIDFRSRKRSEIALGAGKGSTLVAHKVLVESVEFSRPEETVGAAVHLFGPGGLWSRLNRDGRLRNGLDDSLLRRVDLSVDAHRSFAIRREGTERATKGALDLMVALVFLKFR